MFNEIKNNTPELINWREIQFSTQIINITGSSFSLLGLILVLCIIKTKKNMNIFMNELFLYIIISEMINCFSKILEFFKFILIIQFRYVAYVQLILSLFSDFCTLLTSLVISFKLHDSLKNQSFYFKKKKIKKISRFICLGLPSLSSILFFCLDTFVLNFQYKEYDKYFYWMWVHPILSIIIYCFFFLLIIFIVIISFRTISFLKEKQKEIMEQNTNSDEDEDDEEEEEEKEENKDTPEKETKDTPNKEEKKNENIDKGEMQKSNTISGFNESLISDKINKIMKKIYKYPLVSSVIWILLGTYRVTESMYLLKLKHYDIFVCILMILHSFISSFRGVINFIVFFIFQIIHKKDFLELFICKKEDETKITPTNPRFTKHFEE